MKKNSPRAVPKPPAARSPVRFWGLALLGLATAAGTWAVLEFVVWNALPAPLVGKWVVADGPQEGATFEFNRSGKMIGHVNQAGNLAIVHATVRVEGDRIYSTTRHPHTGQESTTVQTIRALTADHLVIEDQKGTRLTLRRADS